MVSPIFLGTFKNTDGTAYQAPAVIHGLNTYPVALFEGRLCYATSSFRIAARPGRYAHNRLNVFFLDDGSAMTVSAGRWTMKAKNAPMSLLAGVEKKLG